jgi:hypothetical protein
MVAVTGIVDGGATADAIVAFVILTFGGSGGAGGAGGASGTTGEVI